MKTKFHFLFSFLLSITCSISASNSNRVRITYEARFNGEARKGFNTIVDISGKVAHIFTQREKEQDSSFPKQDTYINYNTSKLIRVATVNDETIHTISDFTLNKGLTSEPESENEVIPDINVKRQRQ